MYEYEGVTTLHVDQNLIDVEKLERRNARRGEERYDPFSLIPLSRYIESPLLVKIDSNVMVQDR